jgi:hypothetical protein
MKEQARAAPSLAKIAFMNMFFTLTGWGLTRDSCISLYECLWSAKLLVTCCILFFLTLLTGGCSKSRPNMVPVVSSDPKMDAAATVEQARLTAAPNPVSVQSALGKTTITWSVRDGGAGQIYVARDGGPEQLVTQGAEGREEVAWIEPGSVYDFRLYAGLEHKRMLTSVTVKGVKAEH